MPSKFTKKPDTIEAEQFTGGAPNGPDIVKWVVDNGGVAVWFDEIEATEENPGRTEHIGLSTSEGSVPVLVGDWVFRRMDGVFCACKESDFAAMYEAKSVV